MHPHRERRTTERQWLNKGTLLTFAGARGPYSCGVRDLSRDGAGLRLDGLVLIPTVLTMTFDGGRSAAEVELIWREGDFAGVAFRPGRTRSLGGERD
jgi:PilZ domain